MASLTAVSSLPRLQTLTLTHPISKPRFSILSLSTPSPITSPLLSLASRRPSSLVGAVGNGSTVSTDENQPIFLPGCDYNHWLIIMEFPKDPAPTREEMIDTYLQTLATVLGSMEEAKKNMYAFSTTTYTGFQCTVSEETSEKFKGLPGVLWVLPDSYIDVKNKDYGGIPPSSSPMGVMLLLASTNPACVKCELCTKLKAGLACEQHGLCHLVGDKYINGEIIPSTYPTYQPKEKRQSKRENQRYERRKSNPTAQRRPPAQSS